MITKENRVEPPSVESVVGSPVRWMRTARNIAVAAGACYGVGALVAGILLAEMAVHPARRPLGPWEVRQANLTASAAGTSLENVELESEDGVTLHAWFFPAQAPLRASVVLLHGVSDNRASTLPLAAFLLEHGYNVLAPDARAHGETAGVATYGIRERRDVARWVDWLDARAQAPCVYGYGASMGAAILLEAAAESTRFCAVVAEASFATFREVAFDRVGQYFGKGPWLGRVPLRGVVEAGLIYVRLRYGVDLTDANPAASGRRVRGRLLIIHGDADNNIPLRHARMIESAAPPGTETWIAPGVGHTDAITVRPDEFRARVLAAFTSPDPRARADRSPLPIGDTR